METIGTLFAFSFIAFDHWRDRRRPVLRDAWQIKAALAAASNRRLLAAMLLALALFLLV